MRKLQLMLASLAAVPLMAHALGLGSIRVNSALNEPLDAQIELLSATPEEVRSLSVRLASHEDFSRAGIERSAALMALDFQVEDQGRGRYVIDITSAQPVREPFLNFLLDAEWAQGRMLREYTVLLDPPTLIPGDAPARVASPTVQPPSVIARSEAPAPTAVSTRDAARPKTDVAASALPPVAATRESATAPGVMVGAIAEPPEERLARTPADPAVAGVLEYGITTERDTAWSVATSLRPEGVTVYQMLMALLQSNPEAFEGRNINRLKVGHVLRIEDPALLTAMSRQEAAIAVQGQHAAWEDFKRGLAERPGKQTIMAGDRASGGPAAPAPVRSELTLVSAQGEQASAGTLPTDADAAEPADVAALREQLTLAEETAATERQRSRDLNERLGELEDQIGAMQRLISLKDDELATLQEQLRLLRESDEAGESVGLDTAVSAAELSEPSIADPVVDNADAEVAAPVEAAPETRSEAPAPVPAPTPLPTVSAEETPAAPAWQSALAAVTAVLGTTLGVILASPLLMAVAVTVLVLLMLMLLLIVRRRRKLDSRFQESILIPPAAAGAGAAGAQAAAAHGEESSFLSDFAVSGMSDLQGGHESEVDPLTEADVYMAYGRYAQAEEILQQALAKEPARTDFKLKMLELHHASKNRDGFVALAEELHQALGDTDEHWQKVLDLGREVAPEHALFGAAAAPGMSEDDILDIGLDTGIFQVQDFEPKAASGTEPDSESTLGAAETMFDLGSGPDSSGQESGGLADLDFDLEFDPAPAAPAARSEPEPQVASAGDILEFDLGSDLDQAPQADAPERPTAKQGDALEFDLGALEFGSDAGTDPGAEFGSLEVGDASGGDESDGLDFANLGAGLDLGNADDAGLDLQAALSPDADDGGDGELDEVGTKLDLARAYIDMGDPDGARSILDEVLEEGDGTQQKEAQDLLRQIA